MRLFVCLAILGCLSTQALGQSSTLPSEDSALSAQKEKRWTVSASALSQDGATVRVGLGYHPETLSYTFGAELGEKSLKSGTSSSSPLHGREYALFMRYDGTLVSPINLYSKTSLTYIDTLMNGTHRSANFFEVEFGLSPTSQVLGLDLGTGFRFIGHHDTISQEGNRAFESLSVFSALRLSYRF